LGVRKGNKEWLDFINAQLTKMEESGEYHRLLVKWFGRVRGLLLDSLVKENKKSLGELMKSPEK
jgi:hypothetical protein